MSAPALRQRVQTLREGLDTAWTHAHLLAELIETMTLSAQHIAETMGGKAPPPDSSGIRRSGTG